ncbi:hypothetical protein D3C75_542810 [compost metagenome]
MHQLRALAHQFVLIGATTDDGFEFVEVWRDQARTTVDREILALGIGQHRNAAGAGSLDQRLMVFQRAFAVVGQHQHLDAFEQLIDLRGQRQRVGGEGFFEVDTQQLLVTAHDPQLDDGRLVRNALEDGPHAGALEAVDQTVGGFIVAGDTDQRSRSPQGGNVQGNVGSTARAVFDVIDLDHRHRCLRRNP